MKNQMLVVILSVSGLLFASGAESTPMTGGVYSIAARTANCGGTTVTAGQYSASFSNAQRGGTLAKSGGSYDVGDGFWSIHLTLIQSSETPSSATVNIVVKRIPDIRHAINAGGVAAATVLDLDDYALDADDRDTDGVQLPLDWSEALVLGDDNVSITAMNELQVTVPTQGTPSSGNVTLRATDMDSESDTVGPFTVRTANFLLGGPLVDELLYLGTGASTIPYTWCVSEAAAVTIPLVQSASGAGQLTVSLTTGVGRSCFYLADTILNATEQNNPRGPYDDSIVPLGNNSGNLTGVSLLAGNLQVDADQNGLVVEAQAGFEDWARVTVTRSFEDG